MRSDGTALSLEWFSDGWAKSASSRMDILQRIHVCAACPLASACPVLLFAGALQTYICACRELFLAFSAGQWKAGARSLLPCTCGSRGLTVHHLYARGASASCSAVGLDQTTRTPFL